MTPIAILLDTEFTHSDRPQLISLGMVSSRGGEFYVELSDSWNLGECSLFVLGQVLPLLDEGAAAALLRARVGDLFELLSWLTAETFDERKRRLATPELQQAILRELPLALQWEEDSGLGDLRVAQIPRIAAALGEWTPKDLLKGAAVRTRQQAAEELACWLERLARPVRLIADCPLDHSLTQSLLRVSGEVPLQIEFGLLPLLRPETRLAIRRQVQETKNAFYAAGGRRHHALDDARALARWYGEAERLGALPR